MRLMVLFFCVFISFCAGAESVFPAGCQAIALQGETVTLKSKKSKLIIIHNLTDTDLWVTSPDYQPSNGTGLTTLVHASHWSALFLDKPTLTLNCIESRPGHEQQIPCQGAIGVCTWSGAKKSAQALGTFWAVEDKPLDALTAALGSQGLVLPAPK